MKYLRYDRDGLEARCKRLETALRYIARATTANEMQAHARAALQDANDTPTKSEPMTIGDGGAALFAKIAEDAATKMRKQAVEFARKNWGIWWPDLLRGLGALPIDPETGGSDG